MACKQHKNVGTRDILTVPAPTSDMKKVFSLRDITKYFMPRNLIDECFIVFLRIRCIGERIEQFQ